MGVEVRGKTIRIAFSWQGRRYREVYPGAPTLENLKQAERLQGRIRRQIKDGLFTQDDYHHYFPRTVNQGTFGAVAQRWLNSVEVSDATRNEYKKSLNRYWLPELGDTPITYLRPSHLKELVACIEWPSNKTRNNNLIPLRQVLDMAFQDELTKHRLSDYVQSKKHQTPPPDPFTQEEADAICDHLDDRMGNYFEFMFWSGLRTSEALALTWGDVDWRQGYVHIDKKLSRGELIHQTKTGVQRDVLLNDRARAALERHKAHTFLIGGNVFLTEEGQPYATEKAQRAAFTKALRKLGIRHRPQYNTRHSYATALLMAGANPMFVANQLGHSLQVLLKTYAKWIHGEADRRELDKLQMTQKYAPPETKNPLRH